jgi:hypothetical protein
MLKRLLLIFALVLVVVTGTFVFLWHSTPAWIAEKIDSESARFGWSTRSRVEDFSTRGLLLKTRILSPVVLDLPPIRVVWELDAAGHRIPFRVRLENSPGTERQLTVVSADAARSTAFSGLHLDLQGAYLVDGRGIDWTFFELRAELIEPLRAKLMIAPKNLSTFSVWCLDVEVASQNLSSLGYGRLRTLSPLKLQASYGPEGESFARLEAELREAFSFALDEQNLELRLDGLTLSTRLASAPDGNEKKPILDRLSALKLESRYRARHPGLESTGRLEVRGESLDRLALVLDDTLKLRRHTRGDVVQGIGFFRNRVDADLNAKTRVFERLRLNTEGDLDEIGRKQTIAKEISLKTALVCSRLDPAKIAASEDGFFFGLARACSLPSGLSLVVGRALSNQPLRGLVINLQPVTRGDYVGRVGGEWQGAKIFSENLEVTRDFSRAALRLDVAPLSLHEVLVALDQPKLSGRGELKALVNLSWKKGEGLTVNPASFESVGEGILRYADPALSGGDARVDTLASFQKLLAQGQQAMVFKALEDFHYKSLTAVLTRDPKLLTRVQVTLSGSNPALANGQPFEIHIPVEGDVESLLLGSILRDFESLARRSLPHRTKGAE